MNNFTIKELPSPPDGTNKVLKQFLCLRPISIKDQAFCPLTEQMRICQGLGLRIVVLEGSGELPKIAEAKFSFSLGDDKLHILVFREVDWQ